MIAVLIDAQPGVVVAKEAAVADRQVAAGVGGPGAGGVDALVSAGDVQVIQREVVGVLELEGEVAAVGVAAVQQCPVRGGQIVVLADLAGVERLVVERHLIHVPAEGRIAKAVLAQRVVGARDVGRHAQVARGDDDAVPVDQRIAGRIDRHRKVLPLVLLDRPVGVDADR